MMKRVSLSEYTASQNGFTSYLSIDAIDLLHRGFDLQLPHRCIILSVSKNAALTDRRADQLVQLFKLGMPFVYVTRIVN